MTTANICKEQSCNEKIPGGHYLCYKHWQESQEGVVNECPDCGRYKNAQSAGRTKTPDSIYAWGVLRKTKRKMPEVRETPRPKKAGR